MYSLLSFQKAGLEVAKSLVTPALSVDLTIHRSLKLAQAILDVTNNSLWLLGYLYSQGFPKQDHR